MNKIDLIIDALESAHHTNDTGVMGLTKSRLEEALAAARELKALKPVGYMDSKGVLFNETTHPHLHTALYPLEVALAQPEQEPVAWMQDSTELYVNDRPTSIYKIPLYTAPPKRERESISTNDHLCAMLRQVHDVLACTALPMKRPWVGLTAIDIHVLKMNHDKVKVVYTDHAKDLSVLGQDVDVDGLINAIQNKLKELNT